MTMPQFYLNDDNATPGFEYAREPLDDRRLGHLFFYAAHGHGIGFDIALPGTTRDGLQGFQA